MSNYVIDDYKNLNDSYKYTGSCQTYTVQPNLPSPYPNYTRPILMFMQNIVDVRTLDVRDAKDGMYIDIPLNRWCVIHWANIANSEISLYSWKATLSNSFNIYMLYSFTGGSYASPPNSPAIHNGDWKAVCFNNKGATSNTLIDSCSSTGWATLMLYAYQSKSTS